MYVYSLHVYLVPSFLYNSRFIYRTTTEYIYSVKLPKTFFKGSLGRWYRSLIQKSTVPIKISVFVDFPFQSVYSAVNYK